MTLNKKSALDKIGSVILFVSNRKVNKGVFVCVYNTELTDIPIN